ncbi:DKNYY family protein [Mucilaginibacter lappiensis]|uniref:DKNYY family protein n=1 Tax=Mucilaginibacter lappiensis TaxID=354630 RepID=A0ABR6PFW9_9SPHI|nr:DKNYY domain-containing protein [Mucilaginibacter lappiensis]MBB6108657.1 hypothetical protein [Mucilaginibacter lappiensis]SIQ29037.1 DKNYY family protein [Mucilaginibacter lappiensis]
MKVFAIVFCSLVALFCIVIGIFAVKKLRFDHAHEGINLTGEQKDYPYSGYTLSAGQIYYNEPGAGYFLVKDADINTFRSLNTVGDRGTMARDTNHVFFRTGIVPGLKTKGFSYMGNNFCKDPVHVFYGNAMLKDAAIASFTFIKDFYAADQTHLYYKQKLVPGADVRSTQTGLPDEYLSDQTHVYYKGILINGAKPATFKPLIVEDDQWHTQYAFDGEHYFYQQYEIATNGRLQLLSLDKGFGWHGLFYEGNAIYCYDTDRHELILLGQRDNSAPFRMIDRGIFTDGKHIYFTFGKWNSSGGRVPQYIGHTSGICIVDGASPANFKAAGKNTEGTIYQSGGQRYFHPIHETNGNYHPGLLLLEADGTTKSLPTDNALSKFIKNVGEPSIFNKKFYQNLFKPDSGYHDF